MKIVKEADVIMPMPSLLSPKSTGELRLRNKDPAVPVKIYAKSFSEQEDVEMMLKWNLHLSFYYFHACGTVKMGPRNDPTAVVDATLRIHGVQRLRVIDASIMPNINSETTVGPAMMIGEKGADLIKEDWTGPRPTFRRADRSYRPVFSHRTGKDVPAATKANRDERRNVAKIFDYLLGMSALYILCSETCKKKLLQPSCD
ncbi:PREDICTED: glucose dehydrogenase [FAD, quinone]-like isoform X1 [Dinoponera quadriceps]|uniref:Glucose dehydrogenase [FAD, quinone]-like isoform X1 n=1 Tax=Dinoponera quadriceps TaxID=609295 RepID=A0A6P3XFB2_DINQU|nr:PREDICTED: glucose dehydrogenase [FAD, quinone]-like isoform X1 [Dinoponera quadriceps]